MSLEIHNYTWSGERLVQVETQLHHINGVLDEIQAIRKSSNLVWRDIHSACYECEEDGTVTFYEGEVAKAGNPGVWTYVVYDCPEGAEEVVKNPSIDVLAALLKVQKELQESAENTVVDIPNQGDTTSSQVQVLNLQSLAKGLPAITPAFGTAIAEAGAICLTDESHQPGVVLKVEGEFPTRFRLNWQPVTDQIRRCWNDKEYTTEQAAYAIAFLLIQQLTQLTIIERSRKGTGFDYWLGAQDTATTLPFQRMARLEVSGIRKGNRSQINLRVKQKTEQTRLSDAQGLPAYIIVVEFSYPISIICVKHNLEGTSSP